MKHRLFKNLQKHFNMFNSNTGRQWCAKVDKGGLYRPSCAFEARGGGTAIYGLYRYVPL